MSKKRSVRPAYKKTAPAVAPPANEYVSKELAAKRIGLSVRRVLELSQRGLIKRRTVIDPGTKRRQTVFREEDVQAVVDGNQRLLAFRAGLETAGEVAARPPVPQPVSAPLAVPEVPWLTIDQAALYCGLPPGFLLELVGNRRLAVLDVGVRPGGRYRLNKCDIDKIAAAPIPANRGKAITQEKGLPSGR